MIDILAIAIKGAKDAHDSWSFKSIQQIDFKRPQMSITFANYTIT